MQPAWFLAGQVLKNFARMLITIKSRSDLKLDYIGCKTRSHGQIFENNCLHSKGHTFYFLIEMS